MDDRRRLALIIQRALSREQIAHILAHLAAGVRPNCGRTSEWWVHSTGYAIEVMALGTLPPPDPETHIHAEWQGMYLRLCRAGEIIVADHAPRDRYRFTKPMTEYTDLLRRATPADILSAVKLSLG